MMLPGAIAIVSPLIIGFMPGLGAEALGGFLAGATVSGVLMGMFQNNAGGAWDNAKKSFEKGVEINGEMFYKKSEPHKASVTGDTVGDPFKDTSGPSMNILIKLMSIVSLVIAPTLAQISGKEVKKVANEQRIEIRVQATTNDSSKAMIVADEKNVGGEFIQALTADGIIKPKTKVEWKNNSLFIDEVEQPKSISEKYGKLLINDGKTITNFKYENK
jgi:K(+)-stimulated pyrophosphate-energized sodium pump